MRDELRADLLEVGRLLVSMAEAVRTAMVHATDALLKADRETCELVIARDAEIDDLHRQVEERVYDTLARQAPVATDLRLVITGIAIAADLERMGDLAAHVSKIARLRYPAPAIPAELHDVIQEMGTVAEAMVNDAGDIIKSRNVEAARQLESTDDEMDKLRSSQFRLMMDDSWPHGVEVAVDIALLGRYYERIADHAVSMARRVVYLVTGELPVAVGGTAAGSGSGAATPNGIH